MFIGVLDGVDNIGKIGVALGNRTVYTTSEDKDYTLIYVLGGVAVGIVVIAAAAIIIYCNRERLCHKGENVYIGQRLENYDVIPPTMKYLESADVQENEEKKENITTGRL